VKPVKPSRWLQVAKRASEFRMLIDSESLADAARQAEAANQALSHSRRLHDQAERSWRDRLASGQFHAPDDALFRRHHTAVQQIQARQAEAAEDARRVLADAQASLRRNMAEKNALQEAIERAGERHALAQAQAVQREADDVWTIANPGAGSAT
jgi:hypothetical protein